MGPNPFVCDLKVWSKVDLKNSANICGVRKSKLLAEPEIGPESIEITGSVGSVPAVFTVVSVATTLFVWMTPKSAKTGEFVSTLAPSRGAFCNGAFVSVRLGAGAAGHVNLFVSSGAGANRNGIGPNSARYESAA